MPPDLIEVDASHNKVTVFVEELSMLRNKQELCSGLSNKQAFSQLTVRMHIIWLTVIFFWNHMEETVLY